MQLLEVNNDTAKIIYNPEDNKLLPSDFLLIEDSNQKIAGQILKMYAANDSNNYIAEVRLALSIDKDEKLSYYNGYIPARSAKIMYVTTDDITELIANPGNNIYLGNLTLHQKSIVRTPVSLVDDRLLIQSNRDDNTKTILQNIVSELYMKNKKVILLDFDGRYSRISDIPRMTISENFKFPLNTDALDSLLEYDTADCSLEDKAVIQSVVLELRDYIMTLEDKFLPLSLFKDVVISEFSSNPIPGLMLLRNKLWKYAQEGLFAEKKEDFDIIGRIMENENILIADASRIEEKWHKFTLQTLPNLLKTNCYFAFSMNDIPMDKRSVSALYNNQNIIPITAVSYGNPHLKLLKQFAKNQIFFKPDNSASVDEQCRSLVNKLNTDDFILYGSTSLYLALIIKLRPFDVKTSEAISEYDIRRNVDKILYKSKSMLPVSASICEDAVLPVNIPAEEKTKPAEENIQASEKEEETLPVLEIDNKELPELKKEEDDVIKFKTEDNEDEKTDKKPDEDRDFTNEDLDFIECSENNLNIGTLPEQDDNTKSIEDDEFDEILNEKKNELKEETAPVQKKTSNDEIKIELEIPDKEEEKKEKQNKSVSRDSSQENFEKFFNHDEYKKDSLMIDEVKNKAEMTEIMPASDFDSMDIDSSDNQIPKVPKKLNYRPEIKYNEFDDITDMPEIKEKKARRLQKDTSPVKNEKGKEKQKAEKPAELKHDKKEKEKAKQKPAEDEHKKFNLNKFNKLKQKAQNQTKPEKEEKKPAKPPVSAPNVNKGRVQKKELTVYEPETPEEDIKKEDIKFKEGDKVYHPKYGKGVVEGFANYSNTIMFCLVDFEKAGRRQLDPRISELKKID